MKKILLSLIFANVIGAFALTAQSTSALGMNYQAVVRDASGKVFPNAQVSIKIALVSENQNQEAYYTEVHQVTTDFLGQINLVISEGQDKKGTIAEVPWGKEQIWLDVALQGEQNSTFKVNSRTQLLSVPYALHAGTASKLVPDDQAMEKGSGQSIYWLTGGNFGTVPSTHYIGTRDNKELVFKTANQRLLSFKTNGRTMAITNILKPQITKI